MLPLADVECDPGLPCSALDEPRLCHREGCVGAGHTQRRGGGGQVVGRDHNAKAFTSVLAGGGVRGGLVHGATDEFGSASVQDKVHIHDLHATILALLGFDHKKLTYRYNGRDFRLTDVAGNVVKQVIA